MNPYQDLPSKCFWRPAVSQVSPFDIADLYTKKFEIEATLSGAHLSETRNLARLTREGNAKRQVGAGILAAA